MLNKLCQKCMCMYVCFACVFHLFVCVFIFVYLCVGLVGCVYIRIIYVCTCGVRSFRYGSVYTHVYAFN